MIRVKSIEAKNFKSIGNAGIKIEFNSNREMILLDGKVGSGKSMLLSIISYNWFGKDYGGETNIKDLINRKNKKKLHTTIKFTKDGVDGVFEIKRGIKPKRFSVQKDGVDVIDEATNTLLQKYLENEILECTYPIFSQFFINDKFKNFMSLSKSDRRKFMEEMISYLIIFTDMNKRINVSKSDLNTEILQLDRDVDKFIVKSNTLQESTSKNIDEINESLDKINSDIKSINEKLEKHDEDKIKEFLEKYENRIDELEEKRMKLNNKKTRCETKIETYEENKKQDNDVIVCPNCNTEISITDYFNHIDVDEQKNMINKCVDNISKITSKISKLRSKASKLDERKSDINILKKELRIQKNMQIEQKNKIDKGVSDISEKVEQIEKEIEKLENNKNKLYTEVRYLDTIQKIVSDDGLRKYIIKTILPYINKKIKQYMEDFDLHYIFRFDDNFETFISDGSNECSFTSFSSGQKTKTNLSILFAFYYFIRIKSLFNMDLQFFDEVLDRSLDPESTELLFDILKHDNLFYDKNIIVITHKESIKRFDFDRRIKAKIKGGFTKYEE